MPDGRHYPLVPSDPSEIAELISDLESALRNPATPKKLLPRLGHQQQVIYRFLAKDLRLSDQVLLRLASQWQEIAGLHLLARRQFLSMRSTSVGPSFMPKWRIIKPEPPEKLLTYYKKAERETGIDWEVLAAVNLVETGMGRIDGVSIANAQGPMQFLPSTWAEKGIGNNGDIRNPHDAIQAAARYLVRRGGLSDISKGLWGYNNSSYYGKAVLAYSKLMKDDPLVFIGLYHWEIHYRVGSYDLWLPVGYSQNESIPISTYLKLFPASAPPPTTLPSRYLNPSRG
ncbi:transglycosylase SLT domain-containing protein [Prochlorococcus sp. MIT 1341]|uniref:lytic transglycosylase domain-containing protein n=1 Tax=Prochlorococcus sp. MIT 1341 TaxID=3096221 RepID=UPI0039BEDF36